MKQPLVNLEITDFGAVNNHHAQLLGRGIVGVHQRLAAPQKKSIGSRQVQGTAHGGLKVAPAGLHPGAHVVRFADGEAGQGFIGFAAGDAHQIIKKFRLRIGAGQKTGTAVMQVTQVAGVAAVAAPKRFRCTLQQQHRRAGLAGRHCGTQGGVTTTDHQQVVLFF